MQVVVLLPASLEEIDLGILVRLGQREQNDVSSFIQLTSAMVRIDVHVTIQILLGLGSHVSVEEKIRVVGNVTERLAELVLGLVHVLKYLAKKVVVLQFMSGPEGIIPIPVAVYGISLKEVADGFPKIGCRAITCGFTPTGGMRRILGKPLRQGLVMRNRIGFALLSGIVAVVIPERSMKAHKLLLGVQFVRKIGKLLGLVVAVGFVERSPRNDLGIRIHGLQPVPQPLFVCLRIVRAPCSLGPSGEPATQIGTVPVCFRHLDHSLGIALKGRLIRGAVEKPIKGGANPGVPRGILGQKLESFSTSTIGVLYLVPKQVNGQWIANSVTMLGLYLGNSLPENVLSLRQTLGIQGVNPSDVIIGNLIVSGIESKGLGGNRYGLRRLLVARIGMRENA